MRSFAVLCVLSAIAMSSINITLVNIALPVLSADLHIPASLAICVVSLYQLTLLLLLLATSTLGNAAGFKNIFLAGIAVFTLSSVGCAAAHTFTELIFWRVVQGVGAAAIQGGYLSLLLLIYPKEQLGRGTGLASAMFSLTAVAGPPLAAVTLSCLSWHYLFLLNVPVGIAALLLGYYHLPANRQENNQDSIAGHSRHLSDFILHILTFGLFFAAASLWMHCPVRTLLNSIITILCLLIAVLYVRKQSRQATPFLPVDLLKNPVFAVPLLLIVLYFAALMTSIVAFPFVLQQKYGYTPAHAGFMLTAFALATLASSPLAGYLIEKTNPLYLPAAGFCFLSIGTFSLTMLPVSPSPVSLIWRLGLCGIAAGCILPANNFLGMRAAPPNRTGAASGMIATAMMFGQILGMLCVTAVFAFAGNGNLLPFGVSGIISIAGALLACFYAWKATFNRQQIKENEK
ncbi:MAG: MFS transporter [Planctomycetaceae bacterium]|jgi:DHA2 family multidrug resistance protein-like MFS transporter|nr:MFS transporter [Planctomycetaceae bacterium]